MIERKLECKVGRPKKDEVASFHYSFTLQPPVMAVEGHHVSCIGFAQEWTDKANEGPA